MVTLTGLEPATSAAPGEQERSIPPELRRTPTEQGDAHSSLQAAPGRAMYEIEIFAVVASLIGIWAIALVLHFLR